MAKIYKGIKELKTNKIRFLALLAVLRCRQKYGLDTVVSETYRSQERQNELYAQVLLHPQLPAVLLQILWLTLLFKWLAPWAALINLGLSVLAVLFVLYLITKQGEDTYKILWLLVILPFPVPGAVLYLMFGSKRTTKSLRVKLEKARAQLAQTLPPAPEAEPGEDLLGGIDPQMLDLGMRLLGEYQRQDEKGAALIQALRPFLREERQAKLDKAVRIAKLSRVARVALRSLGGGEGHV